MSDGAQDFFDDVVAPAIEEFRLAEAELERAFVERNEERLEVARALVMRRARSAVIELHQFADRVKIERPAWAPDVGLEQLRQWLMTNHCSRRPDDVQVLHDVADAFKHGELSHPRTGRDWFVKSDRAILSMATGYGELSYGEANWSGTEQVIVELLNGGGKRALSWVVWTVADAWKRAMGRS